MEILVIGALDKKVRHFRVSFFRLFLAVCLTFLISCVLVFFSMGMMFNLAVDYDIPVFSPLMKHVEMKVQDRMRDYTQKNLRFLAQEVGVLKADLHQMKRLGQKVSKELSLPIDTPMDEVDQPRLNGRDSALDQTSPSKPLSIGGPLITEQSVGSSLSLSELSFEIRKMRMQMLAQKDFFDTSVALIDFRKSSHSSRLFLSNPVLGEPISSLFGWRFDPFTGQKAMHNGIDFSASVGTPIIAAADGVVFNVENNPSYGLMVDIDHGEGWITRYAHSSKTLVRVNDLVKRGQTIAEVGSSGRSTGAHLHFEVLKNGVAQNPILFLNNISQAKR